MFQAVFKGEGSEDYGGPYRLALDNLCEELMSPGLLPILKPSPNQIQNNGLYRNCFVLNSNYKTTINST